MQTITRTIPNQFKIFDELDSLYAYTSEKHPQRTLVGRVFDKSFSQLVDTFIERDPDCDYDVTFIDRQYSDKVIDTYDTNNVIICFSGGKDSVAAALKYKDIGCNVYLYHMKRINPALSDEWKFAQECANLLQLPIFFDEIKLTGFHDWMEHPMKNMIIASGAIEYGVRAGIGTRVVFGNYTSSLLDDNVFDRCAGDCVDMWDVFNPIVHKIIPDFTVEMTLEHLGETLDIVASNKPIMDVSISCLCRHSLRPYRHKWVHDKFGITLPNNRCGSCYKCCTEYVYMADHDLIEFSEDYYKYCISQLYKVAAVEVGSLYFIQQLWEIYFFYPIEDSKLFTTLENAIMLRRTIRWV